MYQGLNSLGWGGVTEFTYGETNGSTQSDRQGQRLLKSGNVCIHCVIRRSRAKQLPFVRHRADSSRSSTSTMSPERQIKPNQTKPSAHPSVVSKPSCLPCSYPYPYPYPYPVSYPSVPKVSYPYPMSYPCHISIQNRSYPTRNQCNIQPSTLPPYKLNLSALTLSKLPSLLTTPNLKNLSSPPAVLPPTYHFSPPPLPISLNPPPPSPSLSLPLLRAAAELAMVDMYPGLVPGERESGGE